MTAAVRKKKIAMIKIAQKQLDIADDAYRAMLLRLTGKDSCSSLGVGQLNSVIDELVKKGFVITPKNPNYSRPMKTPKYVSSDQRDKVLSMWIALADIGVVKNRSDQALAAYCQKLTGKAHWHFEADYSSVIEGLKGWYCREALKLLCAQLGITNIMEHVAHATHLMPQLSYKHANAKTVNQISAAMAERTIYHIARNGGIEDPIDYIKVKMEADNELKTA